jgi:hypothetical protein
MPSEILGKLCEELEYTDKNTQFFDETLKEDEQEEGKPF